MIYTLRHWTYGLIIFVCLCPKIFAFDIFDYQGAMAKLYGGAGITESRGGESIFYNPANLYKSEGVEFGVDFAPSNLNYKFTPPDPEVGAGNISVPLVPFISTGLGMKDKTSNISFGFVFVPTGANTKTDVKEFPISLGGTGSFQKADLQNTRNSYKFGIGWAYSFNPQIHVGASIIYDYFNSASKIFLSGEEFLTVSNQNKILLLRLGTSYIKKGIATIGVELQPNVKSWYSLSANAAGSREVKTFRQVYRPQVYGLGIKSDLPISTQVFFQYCHEDWVAGTYIDQNPTQTIIGDAPVEFINAHSFVLGAEYSSSKQNQYVVSFSFFGPNKGAGVMAEDGTIAFNGRGVQDFESLKRYHITGGLARNGKGNRSTYYASFIRATASSEEDTPSAGYYELTILMLGYGLYI